MDAAARRRDEYRALLHARKRRPVHHLQRVLITGTMQRYEIRARQQVSKGRWGRSTAQDFLFGQIRIDRQHFHVEGARQLRDPGADVTDTDDAEHLASDLAAHDLFARVTTL